MTFERTLPTCYKLGGEKQTCLYQISSGFCVLKIIQIGLFLAEIFNKKQSDVFLRHGECMCVGLS